MEAVIIAMNMNSAFASHIQGPLIYGRDNVLRP
jgi:hypothetical protein